MKTTIQRFCIHSLLAGIACFALSAWGQQAEQSPPQQPAAEEQTDEPSITLDVEVESDDPADSNAEAAEEPEQPRSGPHREAIVRLGDDAHLGPDESAETVVSVFGSSTSEGEVYDAVVSVFGDTRVTGTAKEVVSVFGDAYVNSHVRGNVAAVFGNLELGSEASIDGEVVVVGGTLKRHPDAVISGTLEEVTFGGEFMQLRWFRPWVEECLLFLRPLAPVESVAWAWWLAAGFLAFYILLGLMFSGPVERCVRTLEEHPGESTLMALISVFLVPVVFMLIIVTVIGIPLVPFFALALFAAGLFGKAVVLATIGRRITRLFPGDALAHVAIAVLIGGLIVTAMYMVPVLGFITFNVIGILGFGVVIYTLLLEMRARKASSAAATTGDVVDGQALVESADASATMTNATSAAETSEPAVPVTTLPRAEFLIRMGALLIDAILVGILAHLLPGSGDIGLLALAIYGALMWKLKGTTVGGIICNLRVVRLDGRDIDWATAIVRALGCFLSLFAIFLGFFWIIFDPERQAWHDKIAGTVVVRVPRSKGLV